MRAIAICCVGALLVACAKTDRSASDTAGGAVDSPAPAPATTIALADVAGKWNVVVKPEIGDSTLTTYVLNATGETTGWTMTFPNRQPIPLRVSVSGDSIMTSADPFESVLRRGVQVSTNGVMRLRDGRLVGTSIAHYRTTGPDSVRRLRAEGTRAQ